MKYAVSGNIPTIPTLEKSPTRPILMSGKNNQKITRNCCKSKAISSKIPLVFWLKVCLSKKERTDLHMTLIRITIRFSTGLLPQDQYDDNWWLLLLNRILTHFKLGTVWKPLWIHATSKSFWMQNSRGKINPNLSLKLPTWGAENPKTKTQVSQYGGQQRNKDRHPGQQDGSHVQVKNTLILHFKTLQFIEDSKKTKKRIEMSNKGSTFLKSGPCFKISTKMMISVIWSTTTSQQRRTPTTP